jgi:hypothetical protein
MLVLSTDSGIGESTLMNAFLRLQNCSTKGPLGWVQIVDDEMEVKKKDAWSGVLVLGVAVLWTTPTLNTSTLFSFIRRDTLRPTSPFN